MVDSECEVSYGNMWANECKSMCKYDHVWVLWGSMFECLRVFECAWECIWVWENVSQSKWLYECVYMYVFDFVNVYMWQCVCELVCVLVYLWATLGVWMYLSVWVCIIGDFEWKFSECEVVNMWVCGSVYLWCESVWCWKCVCKRVVLYVRVGVWLVEMSLYDWIWMWVSVEHMWMCVSVSAWDTVRLGEKFDVWKCVGFL